MPERDAGNSKSTGGINTWLVIFLALVLAGVIAYLLSTINHGRYYLMVRHGQLIIERGRMFPVGSILFKPDDPKLAGLYAPLIVPPGEELPESQTFDSLPELNRQLFAILAGWSRKGMASMTEVEFEQALVYIDRARRLPGLSDEQQRELNLLRGDIGYRDGRRLLRKAVADLRKAHQAFKEAHQYGTSRPSDAYRWMVEIEGRLRSFPDLGGKQDLWIFQGGQGGPVPQLQTDRKDDASSTDGY